MVLPTHSDDTWGGDGVEGRLPGLTCESASPPLVYSHNRCRRVCYVENGEGGFTSDLSTSVFASFFTSFFTSFFAFLITFFASFFLCFGFFPFAIASSCAARKRLYTCGLFFDSPGREEGMFLKIGPPFGGPSKGKNTASDDVKARPIMSTTGSQSASLI